jgi:hypothetical protein
LSLDSNRASISDPISWILRSTRICSSTNTAAARTAVNQKHMGTSCLSRVSCKGAKGCTASVVTPTMAARAECPGVTTIAPLRSRERRIAERLHVAPTNVLRCRCRDGHWCSQIEWRCQFRIPVCQRMQAWYPQFAQNLQNSKRRISGESSKRLLVPCRFWQRSG